MPIPQHIDPMQREWLEFHVVDHFRRQLSGGIVAFLAFGPGQQAQLAGTGFVIGSSGRDALVVTARHVLTEGVFQTQQPRQRHATSALPEFLPLNRQRISVDPSKLRALWFGEETADVCIVHHVHYADSLDIAICLISLQDHVSEHGKIRNFALDTAAPEIGATVNMISTSQMAVEADNFDSSSGQQILRLRKNVSVRMGTVTGVFPQGHRQFRWPCFSTSIPVEPGMSGGMVYRPIDGAAIGACGVVSADCSEHEARNRFDLGGNSVVAMIWPMVGYCIPESLPAAPDTKQRVLLDLLQSGEIQDIAGNAKRLFISRRGEDDYIVGHSS